MISRKQKELTDNDIDAIAEIYHNWRGKESQKYSDVAGLCKSATLEEIRKNNYILTPGRYIEFKEMEDDGVAFAEKMKTLTATLAAQMKEEARLNELIKENLTKLKY